MSAPQITHFADDATLARIAELEKQLAESEKQIEMREEVIDSLHQQDEVRYLAEDRKERYRDRLDRMVAAIYSANYGIAWDTMLDHATSLLSRIDAEVYK